MPTTYLICCNLLTIGKSCAFYLESHGINSVPTLLSAKQLNDSNSEVRHDNKNAGFPNDELDSDEIWCHPRRIYYITKFAKERLVFENSCLEIMTMVAVRNKKTGLIQRFLKVTPFLTYDITFLSTLELMLSHRSPNSIVEALCKLTIGFLA